MMGMPMTRDRTSHGRLGLAHEREQEHGEDHHQQQEARAAARMKGRETLARTRHPASARLVGVDHLVLRPVVLEHPPQVGDAVDGHDVADEDGDAG